MVFGEALLVTASTRPRDRPFPAVVPCGGMAAIASTVLQTTFRMSSLPARLSKGRRESVNTAGDIGTALQKMLWLLLLALGVLLPPFNALAVEPALERCSEFLSSLPDDGGEAEVSFDLEVQLGLAAAQEAYPTYRSIEPLNSGCETGNIIAHHSEEAIHPADLPSYVDVAAGVSGAYRWVQFVYPSVGEYGPGLESSVVFYDAEGVPGLTRLVSAYHSWEGASVLRSVMSQGRIKHCRRQIEFFSYTEDGDIAAELDAPVSSDCEYSWSTYPWR